MALGGWRGPPVPEAPVDRKVPGNKCVLCCSATCGWRAVGEGIAVRFGVVLSGSGDLVLGLEPWLGREVPSLPGGLLVFAAASRCLLPPSSSWVGKAQLFPSAHPLPACCLWPSVPNPQKQGAAAGSWLCSPGRAGTFPVSGFGLFFSKLLA